MRLKKLEITGFKSFHERFVITFPKGISAIVGPNGCGKSNVVDALRWAMGEQSAKQLRGKSMEDVIFSGTAGTPALNMAEVSLTLSNESGSGPEEFKDFAEIMITRRVYRSGERVYYINKQPCRLKDIYNIFVGSGMGAKSYAVIQQGNIGAITDAGPDERRTFIEEASGVTRYKARKTEALRKVASTQRNLLRLNDITSEISRQMASLKRQARKAELYNKFKERIRRLDVLLSFVYHADSTKKISKAEILLKELNDTDLAHSAELKKIDAAVEEIKFRREKKSQEISEQKNLRYDGRRSIDRLENDLAHLRDEIKRLTDEIAELESAGRELESKNVKLVSEINQVEDQNREFTTRIADTNTALAKEHSASQELTNRQDELDRALETAKTGHMELVTQEARLKNISQNASRNKENLARRLKRTDEEEAVAGQTLAALEQKKKKTGEEISIVKREIADLNQRVDETQAQLKEKNSALGRQVKHVQTLEFEKNRSRSQYTTLKKMEDNFEWYKGGVRTVMQAHRAKLEADGQAQSDSAPQLEADILGLMADMLEVQPEYEIAVEAVLGESLQYILVKNMQSGVNSVDFLRSQSAGRSGFIPVDEMNRSPVPAADAGADNLLLSQVTARPGYENLTAKLLGQVLVVDDLAGALALREKTARIKTVVTLQGDLITTSGIIVGGSKDNLAGILSKKSEIKTLEKNIKTVGKELDAGHAVQKKLEEEVRKIEIKLQKLFEERGERIQDEIEAEKALYKVTEDLKHARRHFEVVQLEQEQIMGEADDTADEMSRTSQAIEKIGAEIKAAQENVAATAGKIETHKIELEGFNQKVIDLKLKLTAANAGLENSSNTLRRLNEFREDGLVRKEQLQVEITRKTRKTSDSKFRIEESETSLKVLYERVKKLDAALESDEQDFTAIDEQLRENDRKVSSLISKREAANQKIRLVELDLSQQKMQRENLENRLVERYHKTLEEFRGEFAAREETDDEAPVQTLEEREAELEKCRKRIANITDVNLGAIREYDQLKDRQDFLIKQRDDLLKAIEDLHRVIRKINRITQEKFLKTFNAVNEKIGEIFPRLFEGGSAKLTLMDPNNPLETGVEFMIQPPGKKLTQMSLLSGGEKALSAIAFIFSIFLIKPASFCLMDEIDAPLDDANVFRFNELLQLIGAKSQIIMITHNKRSMEFADTLFGITMEQKGISKIVSVNFDHHGNQPTPDDSELDVAANQ
jgi:chromosome segregation protein